MSFLLDRHDLKPGLILFRRADVKNKNWYCRSKLAGQDRYKVMSLGTEDFKAASALAFQRDLELCIQVRHKIPVFPKTFREAGDEYLTALKHRAAAGEISQRRPETQRSMIHAQLNRYLGSLRLAEIREAFWVDYPRWRRQTGTGRCQNEVSDDTIRTEMKALRAVMYHAVKLGYIEPRQLEDYKRKVQLAKNRRDYFTPEEYRQLCTFARNRITQARSSMSRFYRTIIYHYIQIMCETGMRPIEAKNLRWRDVAQSCDEQGREMLVLQVHGKGKARELVAPTTVAAHFDAIRAISKSAGLNDPVFTTFQSKAAKTLYANMLERLLKAAGLLLDSEGKPRSAYCFRHTYATERLSKGVPELVLSEQMGTSVQMLKDHYGHIKPKRNAGLILQGMVGWS